MHPLRRTRPHAPAVQAGGNHRRHRDRAGRIPPSRPGDGIRAGTQRRRPREARRRGVLRLGTPALAAAGRTHHPQHHAAHERRGYADRRLRRPPRRAAYPGARHAQDHARHARAGQDGREDRRRREPPHGTFRHDPAEGQPHRLRGRHPQSHPRRPRVPPGQGQGYSHRVRSTFAGGHRRGVRRGRRRPHHVRQFHARNDPRGRAESRRPLRDRIERRHHALDDARLRRMRRRLHLGRCPDAPDQVARHVAQGLRIIRTRCRHRIVRTTVNP